MEAYRWPALVQGGGRQRRLQAGVWLCAPRHAFNPLQRPCGVQRHHAETELVVALCSQRSTLCNRLQGLPQRGLQCHGNASQIRPRGHRQRRDRQSWFLVWRHLPVRSGCVPQQVQQRAGARPGARLHACNLSGAHSQLRQSFGAGSGHHAVGGADQVLDTRCVAGVFGSHVRRQDRGAQPGRSVELRAAEDGVSVTEPAIQLGARLARHGQTGLSALRSREVHHTQPRGEYKQQ